MIKQGLFYSLFISCLFSSLSLAASVSNSVVQVFVNSRSIDMAYPWQMENTLNATGSAVVIDKQRILTAAHVVDNALSIKVRRVGFAEVYEAKIQYISDERDLALLTVENKEFFKGSEPIQIAEPPKQLDEVTIYGFPEGGQQLAITKGVVSRIDYTFYSHTFHSNLIVQVDAAINGGASGGPALIDGKLAGINFQSYNELENVGHIIPSSVVTEFLKDTKDGKVHGVPDIALYGQNTDNVQIEMYYEMDAKQTGILVTRVPSIEKENGIFKTGDIIMSIDGVDIASDGTISMKNWDRIDWNALLVSRQIGDVLSIELLRDGEVKTIQYQLSYNRQDALKVVRHYSGFTPNYLIVGGLVFQDLSFDYAVSSFEDQVWPEWMDNASIEYHSDKEGIDRFVFLSTVLPNEINVSYGVHEDSRLVSINGVDVINVDQLKKEIGYATDIIRMVFDDGYEIIFYADMLKEARKEFMDVYGVDSL